MIKEQRFKRVFRQGLRIKEYSFKSSKQNSHSKEQEIGRKGKSSWSGGSEHVGRDLSEGKSAEDEQTTGNAKRSVLDRACIW